MRSRPARTGTTDWRLVATRTLAFAAAWAVIAVPTALLTFQASSETTDLASHRAVVSPTFDGYATLGLGPYIPNLRIPTHSPLGAEVLLGKTDLTSYEALIQRYAAIAGTPEAEIDKLREALMRMAVRSLAVGALAGLAVPTLWVLLGDRRRSEISDTMTLQRTAAAGGLLLLAVTLIAQPWSRTLVPADERESWLPITDEFEGVSIPSQAQDVEVQSGLMTSGTRQLAQSAFDSYARSLRFYDQVVKTASRLSGDLRQPQADETVALLVSDRHDNIGMDKVARTIAAEGRATMLLDAGDDTSTGSSWEAFSLDSLDNAFDDFEHRFAVSGNHDNGSFVSEHLGDLGFTTLHGEAVDGPGDITLLGADDPRNSGLGTWREESGRLSFSEQAERLANTACQRAEDGERISTLLVHDANSGRVALDRGCVDLVVGGHIHAQLGPELVLGENGRRGYTYTNGTTGGAAYALAIGSKLRRDAQVTLVTYRAGRPVGIQPVTIRTVGDIRVADYVELDLADRETEAGRASLDDGRR